jgi:hypothetical protein
MGEATEGRHFDVNIGRAAWEACSVAWVRKQHLNTQSEPQRKQRVSKTTSNWLMQFREVIAVYSVNHMKSINTLLQKFRVTDVVNTVTIVKLCDRRNCLTTPVIPKAVWQDNGAQPLGDGYRQRKWRGRLRLQYRWELISSSRKHWSPRPTYETKSFGIRSERRQLLRLSLVVAAVFCSKINTNTNRQSWRWKQYVPPKRWHIPTSPHAFTTQMANIYI